ncbi:RNA-directed DNA polymerase, eukaryota [Tanacetum coccineum]
MKDGKKIGFVRFINVFNTERLVSNLCTIWVGRSKFHANVARFHRTPVKINKSSKDNVYEPKRKSNVNKNGSSNAGKSYAHVLKTHNSFEALDCESAPSIVLDDDCLNSRDLSKTLLALDGFLNSCDIDDDDESEEGSKGDTANSHGAFNFDDADDVDKVPETELDDPLEQNENPSEDPFGIYSILNKNKDNDANIPVSDHSIKFPPGFTPNGVSMQEDIGRSVNDVTSPRIVEKEQNEQERINNYNGSKDEMSGSVCSGIFKKPVAPQSGGSILCVLEELVKVGQAMGYNMKGLAQKAKKDWVKELCLKNKVNFLALQETKMENMNLWCVKACWGNYTFDYAHSDSVGNSGGILCIWDPNSFQKDNVTVSDFFIIIRGTWLKSGVKILMVAVYAPHDLRDKRFLWELFGVFILIGKIREWLKFYKSKNGGSGILKEELNRIDADINKGLASDIIINKRMEVIKSQFITLIKIHVMDLAQKAKVSGKIIRKLLSLSNQPNELEVRCLKRSKDGGGGIVVPDKARGPDGFCLDFYSKIWNVLK